MWRRAEINPEIVRIRMFLFEKIVFMETFIDDNICTSI